MVEEWRPRHPPRAKLFNPSKDPSAAGAGDHAEVFGILYLGARSLRAENGLL
jgi:hypothetical protein